MILSRIQAKLSPFKRFYYTPLFNLPISNNCSLQLFKIGKRPFLQLPTGLNQQKRRDSAAEVQVVNGFFGIFLAGCFFLPRKSSLF